MTQAGDLGSARTLTPAPLPLRGRGAIRHHLSE
jgi:hypothetical protein